jgi:hypothetical protein
MAGPVRCPPLLLEPLRQRDDDDGRFVFGSNSKRSAPAVAPELN